MTNTPKNRQTWIFDLLKSEGASFSEAFSKYLVKFSKSEVTFSKDWNKANETYSQYVTRLNEAKDVQSIAIEVEALTNGLKSKIERQLELQKQVSRIERILEIDSVEDYFIHQGNPKRWERPLNPTEKARYNSLICTLQAELSKMDGSYSPIKNDMVVTNITPIDLDYLTDEEKSLLAKIYTRQP